jgi:FkbM family methyltransferase
MTKTLTQVFRFLAIIIGKNRFEKLLVFALKSVKSNLHIHGLIQIGAAGNHYLQTNGERYFVENVLPNLIPTNPTIFDVGANTGEFSTLLSHQFPSSNIFAFEPIKNTFETLKTETSHYPKINLNNLGLSDKKGIGVLYNTKDSANSEIATLYKEALEGIFETKGGLSETEFEMDTLDSYCQTNKIEHIDFLKIDVEGHELGVLKGSIEMLKNNLISVIQFEFNEHNIYAKVFLNDFYKILPNFDFFRILPTGLCPMGSYNVRNEIFTLQNIIAIRRK